MPGASAALLSMLPTRNQKNSEPLMSKETFTNEEARLVILALNFLEGEWSDTRPDADLSVLNSARDKTRAQQVTS